MSGKGYSVVVEQVFSSLAEEEEEEQDGEEEYQPEDAGSSFKRYVYVKEHRCSGAGKGKTLFVGNVDDQNGLLEDEDVKERLTGQWGVHGRVEHVELGDMKAPQEGGGGVQGGGGGGPPTRFALIRFASVKQMKKALTCKQLKAALQQAKEGEEASTRPVNAGFAGAKKRHRERQPPRAVLQAKVDSFMESFDEAARADAEALERRKEVDDDGFELVTYKRKRGKIPSSTQGSSSTDGWQAVGQQGGAGVDEEEGRGLAGGGKRRKPRKELTNFYSFQRRDAKRDQLSQLRDKFELDKKRVAKMKEARKFKPF